MQNAAQAYAKVAKQIVNPRELEADLLLKAASRLQTILDAWDRKKSELDAALLYNRKLWSIFMISDTNSDHALPAAIRQNIANLGLFVMNQTVSMMTNPKREQLNPLISINRELAADFDLDAFSHRSFYKSDRRRIEMHLVSARRQKVNIAGHAIEFAGGETIHTENSYKYTIESFGLLAQSAGWTPVSSWSDGYFSVHALAKA